MPSALDLQLDELLPKRKSVPQLLLKVRTTHHEIARLLALGLKDIDISRTLGYSQSRISILKNDPLFKELLDHYVTMRDGVVLNVGARLESMSVTALELIQERMLDDPESISMKDLQGIAELSLDRSGHGKTSTVNVNTVSVQTLAEIKASIEQEHRGRVLPRNHRAEDCIEATFTPISNSEAEETQRG